MFYAEIDKYIMGTKPISDYDQFIDQLNKAGAAEMEKIYQSEAAKLKKQYLQFVGKSFIMELCEKYIREYILLVQH